jgi:hypothetical protein
MVLNAKLRTVNNITARVNTTNGIITPVPPIVIRNQIQEQIFNSIEDLPDVAEVSVTDGATLVYNANNDLYEVKQLVIDGGEF